MQKFESGRRAVSNAPLTWPIVRIDPEHPPDVVPDCTVLEFPTRERVWRSANEDRGIVIESFLGAGSKRKHFERNYFRRGEMGRADYTESDMELSHSQGAGTGFESPYAIPYAPREVNQELQNLGIEEFLRELERNRPREITIQIVTNTRTMPRSLRLSLIEYTINAIYQGERYLLFTTGIRVEWSANRPSVSIAGDLTDINPEAVHLLPMNDLAETMLERRLELMSRVVEGRSRRR